MWSNDGYPNAQGNGTVGVVHAPVDGAIANSYQPPATGIPIQVTPAGVPTADLPVPVGAMSSGTLGIPSTLDGQIRVSDLLSNASLLPKALQGQPANIFLIMQKAIALGIPLTVALEHLHVIDGKVGHSAELLRVLLRRAGHRLDWPTSSDKEVVGELTLRHDPKHPRRAKFTMADAQRMELVNKKNWRLDPESMLIARCTTRLVSRHCPEVSVALGNLSAIDFEDVDAEPVKASAEVDRDHGEPAVEVLLREAAAASTVDELKDIGGRAKDAKLLDAPIEGGGTVQEALLRRMDEISKARKASADKPPADPPAEKAEGSRSGKATAR